MMMTMVMIMEIEAGVTEAEIETVGGREAIAAAVVLVAPAARAGRDRTGEGYDAVRIVCRITRNMVIHPTIVRG